jgi:hypothetical protein
MIKSLLYKEWLKLRYYWTVAFLINILFLAYLFIDIRHQFVFEHAEMIWYQAFHIGNILYDKIKYLPLVIGIIIGAAQFVPEMLGNRFRLSLHLPVEPDVLVFRSVVMGILSVGGIFLIDVFLLCYVISVFFPLEGAKSAFFTSLSWFFAGIVAYTGTALCALEPQNFRKIVYLVLTAGFILIFYQGDNYESYNRIFLKPAIISFLFIPSVIFSAYRYRNRTNLA